ncbi:hypothetical protein [Quadrisphaera sp. DSM 44207]|uniref:hypothetical protein n=1 Tax=Quadrisphaera sp. DSM 44207 TaxID=1881057 RepID=UPI0015A495B7|nr:hypothetical protein [Quadrisphaera sp. DSM 44207]
MVVQSVVLGVADLDRAVRFWSALLHLRPREEDRTARWCALDPVSGEGPLVDLDHA